MRTTRAWLTDRPGSDQRFSEAGPRNRNDLQLLAVLAFLPGVLRRVPLRTAILFGFGPTWLHPQGSHVSPFPWAHLLFSQRAILRWRSLYWPGTPSTWEELGLNRMTIARFEKLAKRAGFSIHRLECVPIGRLRWAHCHWTREFTTTFVRGVLCQQ